MFRILGASQAFKRDKHGHLSSFQALQLSIAGRVGGGNIAGVAVAITLGGPGAIFWMWLVGLIGMATSFLECTLAQAYKTAQPDGTYRGGPAYYIARGLGSRWKWLAALYSVLLLVTFGFGFTALQSYAVATSFDDAFGIPVLYTGIGMASGADIGGVALTQVSLADHVGEWGRSFVSVALLLFGFSTILYNYYLGENSLNYFSDGNVTLFNLFRIAIVALCAWGALTDLGTVFAFADVTMGFLALANLIALLMLFKPGLRLMRDFDEQIRAGIRHPVFDAQKFADLDIDPAAWEIEPEDIERLKRYGAAAPTAGQPAK